MDPLASVLAGPSARGAFVLRCSLEPPWAMRIADEAPLSVVALVRGQAYIVPSGGAPVLLRAGDVAVVRGPEHYTVADEIGTTPQVRIEPGQVCIPLAGPDTPAMTDVGVRTWGNARDGSTLLLDGTYESQSMVGRRVLAGLPQIVVAPREHVPSALIDYLSAQISRDEPGQAAVLDRILDLVLIAVLRWWFASSGSASSDGAGWYRASADPVVGQALVLMQEQPAAAWTVEGLGATTGLSRAAFARRFTALVGEPPMSYLTGWRMSLAADLLAEPGATVASVARRVGYGTPFAFSTAFKREHQVSPQQYRASLVATTA
ncbi:AraC family transcriptional regulator [Cellulomonas sp. URHD0024]|uniref:AraC family transcriptional regulator n=1 Tax=Cellulomonas sp. URHD0024 TaxID=1302620 RepID=UPI0004881883|nr:AraC family transcriptional regulator [Cellulomonas sp. URHD0024]